MVNSKLEQLKDTVREKQQLIANNLINYSYEELIKLISSLHVIISELEHMYARSDVLCNRIIADHMEADSRASFSKVEAIMKSSYTYIEHRTIVNLKQCASREVSLVKIHLRYVLRESEKEDESDL